LRVIWRIIWLSFSLFLLSGFVIVLPNSVKFSKALALKAKELNLGSSFSLITMLVHPLFNNLQNEETEGG